MKVDGAVEEYLHPFLSLVVGGIEWSASHLVCFMPQGGKRPLVVFGE
jgi:hypothetical protein